MHGEISLASIAEAQALGVAAAAASTLLVIVPKRYGWLWIVSLAVWAVLAWPIIENQMQPDRDPISDALRNVTDPMEAGGALGDHALRFVDLRWGGFALLGGVLLLTWTAWIALRRPKQA